MLGCFSHVRLCNPIDHGPPVSSVPGILHARITEVGCPFLLQKIFPTQGSNLGLLHCRQILYHWATREAQSAHQVWPCLASAILTIIHFRPALWWTSSLDDKSLVRRLPHGGIGSCVTSSFEHRRQPQVQSHQDRLPGGSSPCVPEAMKFRGDTFRPPDTQRPALLFLGQCQGCAGACAGSGGLCCPQRTCRKQLSLASTDQQRGSVFHLPRAVQM